MIEMIRKDTINGTWNTIFILFNSYIFVLIQFEFFLFFAVYKNVIKRGIISLRLLLFIKILSFRSNEQ